MNALCLYNGKVYNKIYSFNVGGYDFAICKDNKKYVYFKHDVINDKDIYTPYDRWITAFEISDLTYNRKIDDLIDSLNRKRIRNNNNIKHLVDKQIYGKKTKSKKLIFNKYFILLIMCLSSLVFGGITLLNWHNEDTKSNHIMKKIIEKTNIEEETAFTANEIPEITGDEYGYKYGEDYWNYMKTTMMSVDFSELKKINPDTKGWLYVNNTNVNYPFVQGGDNSYYLDHSFDGTYNVAGWLFADYKSNLNKFEKNTVIYGHGRVEEVMFGSLNNTLDESWYTNKENQIIKLSTEKKNTLWQIVSIYTIPSESYYLTHTFENDESYQTFLNTMLSRSIYDFGVDLNTSDKLLTLSTCLDFNGNRIVVQAKLIKEQKR